MLNLFSRNRFVETNRYWKREPVAYRNIYLLTMARHIAGKLKQSNKKHKSNVSSNRAQQRTAGAGKVAGRPAGKPRAEGSLNAKQIEQLSVSKSNRVNHKLQLRKKKLEDTWLSRRIGTSHGPPKVVAIIPLSRHADAASAVSACLSTACWLGPAQGGRQHATFLNNKARLCFMASGLDMMQALRAAQCADIVVLVLSAASPAHAIIDEDGSAILAALRAEGMPEALVLMQGVMHGFDYSSGLGGSNSVAKQADLRHAVQAAAASAIGPDVKCIQEENSALLIRSISVCIPRDVSWRNHRSYLLSEKVEMLPSADVTEPTRTIKVSGFLRGTPMHLHSLMHVAGVGACRVVSVETAVSPYERTGGLIETALADRSKQDSLLMEAVHDGIAGEQTWPSEAEMGLGEEAGTVEGAGRLRRKLPGQIPDGMSAYQADWMVGDDGEWLSGEEDGQDMEGLTAMEEKEYHEAFAGEDLDAVQEPAVATKRSAEVQSNLEFPDEMDTPEGIPARQRFARYRALQSFRSSPWHPKENLPEDYARLHQFERFENSQRWVQTEVAHAVSQQNAALLSSHSKSKSETRARSGTRSRAGSNVDMDIEEADLCGEEMVVEVGDRPSLLVPDTEYVRSGIYVSIVLAEVPIAIEATISGGLMLFGLLRHENKASVLHFTIQRTSNYTEPIKSKDRLIMQVGFRMFPAKPIFSEANLNCDKHKMERYLPAGAFSVASCYGPVTFQPCPVLLFKEVDQPHYAADGTVSVRRDLVLVAAGSLGSVDPNRIVLKRIILTGHPVRVHKRCAVLKHLFHEPQDARWFKPAELVTKHGLRGHIREPVGTHGLLKAVFNSPLKQNDTVMLILYKRVYPKFPEEGQLICV